MLELLIHQPIFIGFKVDNSLRNLLESLNDSDSRYCSRDDSTYLRFCRVGADIYIGKLVHDSLTTDQVEDIRHNVLSILRKIAGEARLPVNLKIFACTVPEYDPSAGEQASAPSASAGPHRSTVP